MIRTRVTFFYRCNAHDRWDVIDWRNYRALRRFIQQASAFWEGCGVAALRQRPFVPVVLIAGTDPAQPGIVGEE